MLTNRLRCTQLGNLKPKIYFGGGYTSGSDYEDYTVILGQLDYSGQVVWRNNLTYNTFGSHKIYKILVDSKGNLYAIAYGNFIKKYNGSGILVGTGTMPIYISDYTWPNFSMTNDDFIIYAESQSSDYTKIRKVSTTDFSIVATYTISDSVGFNQYSFMLDYLNRIYICYYKNDVYKVIRLNPDLTVDTSFPTKIARLEVIRCDRSGNIVALVISQTAFRMDIVKYTKDFAKLWTFYEMTYGYSGKVYVCDKNDCIYMQGLVYGTLSPNGVLLDSRKIDMTFGGLQIIDVNLNAVGTGATNAYFNNAVRLYDKDLKSAWSYNLTPSASYSSLGTEVTIETGEIETHGFKW